MPDKQKNSIVSIFMILNFLLMASNQAFITIASPIARLLNITAWQMGAIISMVGITWVISVRFWGRASDIYGRIRVLIYALMGFVMSCIALAVYMCWALASINKPPLNLTLAMLLAIRILIGFFAANIPISINAWIADSYTTHQRITQLSKIGATGAMGMVFAPFIAGLLGHYNLALTLAVFAILPLLLLPFLFKFKDTSTPINLNDKTALLIKDRRVFSIWVANLMVISSIIISNECLGFYLIDNLGLQASQAPIWIGIILSCTGIAFATAQILLSKFKNYNIETLIAYGAIAGAFGFFMSMLLSKPLGILTGYILSGFGIGLALPLISGLAMNQVTAQEQGECASIMALAQGVALILAPIVGTVLYDVNHQLPFSLIITILLLIPWLIKLKSRVT